MAKRAREHNVKERRALKQEKKLAARMAKAAGLDPSQDVAGLDPSQDVAGLDPSQDAAPESDAPGEHDSPAL